MNSSRLLWELILYFLKLGATGFGGPVALAAYMERDLVEKKKWVTPQEYRLGFALAQTMPGPLAAQLAIWMGFIRGGALGAALTGIAFVFPSFCIVVAFAFLYVHYGELLWVRSVFHGIGPAVVAIVLLAAIRLIRKTLVHKALLWFIFAVLAVVTAYFRKETGWLFIASGLLALIVYAPPKFLKNLKNSFFTFSWFMGPLSHLSWGEIYTHWSQILIYFGKAGTFIFGSGLVIVPFLYGGVVHEYHWLTEKQFIDAVAIGMITPGPVLITVAFIGYLVSGFSGALLASLGIFAPCYLFTVIPGPYFKKYADNAHLKAVVDGITAAAIGAIAGSVWILASGSIISRFSLGIAALSLILLAKFKIPEPIVVCVAGLVGFALF